ncbi:LapA family protein [Halalkalibacter urbisdiaboli]|uniref:LapA family protein n=1 Tax=Halalkalibacter urbisdiaboli TaxID=1960589 RepID=UPI000B433CC6|nr:lipopolysaccharide assembly protein LapA domain-containing protein [Halalkalibacter urbisdiaboli]
MRGQWGLILGLIAAIIISIFAIINVDAVRVNYLFGVAEWPLILVILGSVLMGAIIAGALGMVRFYQLKAEIRRLKMVKDKPDVEIKETASEREEKENKEIEKNEINN